MTRALSRASSAVVFGAVAFPGHAGTLDLRMTPERLQPDWIVDWLMDRIQ